MDEVRRFFVGILTFFAILIILSFWLIPLSIANTPRIIPNHNLKIYLGSISNKMGNTAVANIRTALKILHKLEWDIQIPEDVNTETWYIAMSNHQSWADIFVLLIAGHKKIPLVKFFMKKELQWIPIIYLVHKTIDMPFLNRHSRAQIQANPELKKVDYENAKKAAKRFSRNPATAFSFAEGTRNNPKKHAEQNSPYKNLLAPKIGGIALGLSAVPKIDYLLDFTIVYKSKKRSFWDFCIGDLSDVKVFVKRFRIPESLKRRDYLNDHSYRTEFREWLDSVWVEKDKLIDSVNF